MSEKRHLIKQQKAVKKALDKLMKEMYNKILLRNNAKEKMIYRDTNNDCIVLSLKKESYDYEYELEDNCIYITPSSPFIKDLKKCNYELPSLESIIEEAKNIYKGFDSNQINKVVYLFSNTCFKGDVDISAPDSEIKFNNTIFEGNMNIQRANSVELFNSKIFSNCDVSIRSNKIYLGMFNIDIDKNLILISNDIEISNMYIESSEDIIISSSLLSFINTGINAKEIDMSADMIDSDDSTIKAERKIVILDKNNDAIKGIEAPIVIYNGYDITHSEGLEMPKLKERLLKNLKKMKDTIDSYIEKDTKSYNQSLKETPITKILNKKNI